MAPTVRGRAPLALLPVRPVGRGRACPSTCPADRSTTTRSTTPTGQPRAPALRRRVVDGPGLRRRVRLRPPAYVTDFTYADFPQEHPELPAVQMLRDDQDDDADGRTPLALLLAVPPNGPRTDRPHLCITTRWPTPNACTRARARRVHTRPASAARRKQAHLLHSGDRYKAQYRTHPGIPNESARDSSCNSRPRRPRDSRHEHRATSTRHRSEHHQEHADPRHEPAASCRRTCRTGGTPGGSRAPRRRRSEGPAEPRAGHHLGTGRARRGGVVGGPATPCRAGQCHRSPDSRSNTRRTTRGTTSGTTRDTPRGHTRGNPW